MKDKVAKLWIDALRSDRFKQSTGALHNVKEQVITIGTDVHGDVVKTKTIPAGHCCLGVLCELAIEAGVEVKKSMKGCGIEEMYDDTSGELPESVKQWAGMQSTDGDYERPGTTESLAGDNDAGQSFLQIADTIEKYWRDL